MITREGSIEIEQYCSEHKVGKKDRLAELGIPFWNFYRARRKYQRGDERNVTKMFAGKFIPLSNSPLGPVMQPSKWISRKTSHKEAESIVKKKHRAVKGYI